MRFILEIIQKLFNHTFVGNGGKRPINGIATATTRMRESINGGTITNQANLVSIEREIRKTVSTKINTNFFTVDAVFGEKKIKKFH